MAVLTTPQRQQIWRGVMRFWSLSRDSLAGMTKADIQAAVDATDDWIDTNANAFNSALPLPFRTSATATQKTFLFCAVALARVADVALLKRLIGEVD